MARAIFPNGNLVMRMYDELGLLFHDRDFADLFPIRANRRKPRCAWLW